jgi:hypothetical protein
MFQAVGDGLAAGPINRPAFLQVLLHRMTRARMCTELGRDVALPDLINKSREIFKYDKKITK